MDTMEQFGLAMVVVGLMGVLDRVFDAYPEFREIYEREGQWAARNALYVRAEQESKMYRALNKRNANLRYYKAVECKKYYDEADAHGRIAADLSYAFKICDCLHHRDGIRFMNRNEWIAGWCDEWSLYPLNGGYPVAFRRDRGEKTFWLYTNCDPRPTDPIVPQPSPATASEPIVDSVDGQSLSHGLLSAPTWRLRGGYDTRTFAVPQKVRAVGGTRRRRNARRRVNR